MKTKKLSLMVVFVLTCVALMVVSMGGTAFASPSKTQVCTDCHYLNVTVSITVTKTSETTTTETYSVNGSTAFDSAEGWAVFTSAGTATGKYGTGTGSFTLNKGGATYTVYWTDDSDNSAGTPSGKGGTAKTTVTTGTGGVVDTQAPTNPSGLTATAASSSQINLTWTASTDNVGVVGYQVDKSTNGTTFTLAGTSATTSYSATGLTASTPYWFRVRAYDAVPNYSGDSTVATATTQQTGTPPTSGQYTNVIGSPHDMGVAPVCSACHKAHNAYGDFLWARPVGGTFVGIKALCYSCHDGTITPYGGYAFNAALAQHPVTPGTPGADCDRCHNPHNDNYGSFLKFAAGANLCGDCHTGLGISHPTDVDSLAMGVVPADAVYDPNFGDMSGTNLFNTTGSARILPPLPSTGGYVKCLTCHTAHAGIAGTKLNTMAYSGLCQNCHP